MSLRAVGNDSGITAHDEAGVAKQVMQRLTSQCKAPCSRHDSGIVAHNSTSVAKQVIQRLTSQCKVCAVGNDSETVAHKAAVVAKQVMLTSLCKALCCRQRFWDCCS